MCGSDGIPGFTTLPLGKSPGSFDPARNGTSGRFESQLLPRPDIDRQDPKGRLLAGPNSLIVSRGFRRDRAQPGRRHSTSLIFDVNK